MNKLSCRRLFVPGRGISTPQKPAPAPSRCSKRARRERIPFIREGAGAIPVQSMYEDAAENGEGEE